MQPHALKKIRQRRREKVTAWHWLALGVGTALVLTASFTTAYRWLQTEEEESDPRAEQVQELLKEAERLLAQGRGSSGE
ncbi:MAG: hypothetical protein WC314_04775 [Vulcanimicrobiota bacterium]